MPRLEILRTALFCLALTVGAVVARADGPGDSWPTFRGPDRTGVSLETGLLQEWPEDGPKLAWQAAGAGRGYASLAIADGRIFTLGDGLSLAEDKDEYLVCFDLQSGKPLWKTKTGAPWVDRNAEWSSSRSTPTVDGANVYVLTASGEMVCCVAKSGKEVWRKNLKRDFAGVKADDWGYSESVLIDGDVLVCTPGGPKHTVVALNKQTGELIWSAAQADNRGAGHASMVVSQVGSVKVYVQSTGSGALGISATDGKILWSYPIDNTTAVVPTPIIRDDLVFYVVGYSRGGALLRQIPQDGGVAIEEVYRMKTALGNKHGGVVLVGDYLFGDSEDNGLPYCAELMKGSLKWKGRGASGSGSASLVAADGCLYLHYADGMMVLAKADPKAYTEISKFRVPGSGDRPSWSHPVILGGKLYLREQDTILCYDISASP